MPRKAYKGRNLEFRRGSGNYESSFHNRQEDYRPARIPVRAFDENSNYRRPRPKVSFKNQLRSGGIRKNHKLEMAVMTQMDDDVTMSSHNHGGDRDRTSVTRRGHGSRFQRGARVVHNPDRQRHILSSDRNWFKVIVAYGQKYDKNFVINSLLSHISPAAFKPIMYKISGQDAIFFVDGYEIANKLLDCDRRITTADGFKIGIRVRSGYPNCEVDSILKEKMKLAMGKRYVAETNALDLSEFHHDPELVEDYFCALFRPTILASVLEIAAEAVPNLHALNLSNNKIGVNDKLSVIPVKFPNLKILYMSDNKMKEMNQIDLLKNLNLEELQLKGNPLCNRYQTRNEDYVRDVRKRFPKLLRLDGVELPKPIVFDIVDDDVTLPPSKIMFASDSRSREIAVQFMQQYFTIFDSDSRQPLLDAYHENACFSLTITPSPQIQKFNKYLSDNRNLFRTNEPARRRKLLKQGRLQVVSHISEMPKTQHYLNSFTMDISLVADSMMLITVTGCFKELDSKDQPIRSFNRTFIIVPEGTGFCIKNEQLHITQPTLEQEKSVQNNQIVIETKTPKSNADQLNLGMAVPGPSTSTTGEPSIEIQKQMTMLLSQQTNMNLEWALKCLIEVQWNYDTALAAFNDFFKRGEIPQAAFQK